MALSVVLIFYYFCRRYSCLAGVYSVAVSLSSFMVWSYWAEARPYALWVFLTTAQLLIFLEMVRKGRESKSGWMALTAVHMLLSLSVPISIIQIAIVSLLLWVIVDRNWKKYILSFAVPMAAGLAYYALAPKYKFWFQEGPWALVNASIPKDRFLIFFIFTLYYSLSRLQLKRGIFKKFSINVLSEDERRGLEAYFWLTALMISGSFLMLLKMKFDASPTLQGFQISNRYFISLVPVGIIATTLFSVFLVKGAKNRFIRWLVLLFLAALLVIRIYRTVQLVS